MWIWYSGRSGSLQFVQKVQDTSLCLLYHWLMSLLLTRYYVKVTLMYKGRFLLSSYWGYGTSVTYGHSTMQQ